jgi:NAD-dependent SIR2 family protein deacetylase
MSGHCYAGHGTGESPRCDSCGESLDVQPRENGPDVGWCDGCGPWYLRPRTEGSADE